MDTAIELLRELAALKRYDKNGHPNRSEHIVTLNTTTDLLERIDALLSAPIAVPMVYPDELTDDLRDVLGWPNFKCAPVAHVLRAGGMDVKRKSEDEQAVVLHWFIKLVLTRGADWWLGAREEIEAIQERLGSVDEPTCQSDAAKARHSDGQGSQADCVVGSAGR
ncbi:hypothetical protein [Paraburkholderia sp. C35]|uniref:hypothetical protein n=1 Tax=Paraburkholderia sp. C35 TaxID=2126993 RepID=UPI000D69BD48|nr:hypothetical protein [Paraburkholderia sp. C35]